MKRRKGYLRIVVKLWKSVTRELKGISRGMSSILSKLTAIREEPVIVGGKVSRTRPSWSNFLNPVFWLQQGFWFFSRYLKSRDVIAGVQGIPAMIGIVAPLVATFWLVRSLEDRTAYAQGRMAFHEERSELEQADFYARQLCFLAPKEPDVLLARARLLNQMEREDEATAVALQLANEHNYLPAVEWLSEKELLAISSQNIVDDQRDRQLESWLTWIIERQPDHLRANLMLGTLKMMRGQYVNAIQPLRTVTQRSTVQIPEAWYSLALSLKMIGRVSESQSAASIAADAFLLRHSRQTFELQQTLQTLRAMVLAAREEEAAMLIQQLLPQRTEEEAAQLRWLLGDVYAQLSKRLRTRERRSPAELAQAVDAIYRGVAVAQSNPVVMEELTQLSCNPAIDDASLQQQLNMALNSGVSPGLVHFILGTRLLTGQPSDPAAALQHFELAEAHNASLPGLLNNMADAMVESDDTDLAQAERLVNQAIELMPDQPYFYDTQGKILLRQGKAVQAIAALEKALAAPTIRGTVHGSLARAWKSLGNEVETERHRKLSAQYGQQQTSTLNPTLQLDQETSGVDDDRGATP